MEWSIFLGDARDLDGHPGMTYPYFLTDEQVRRGVYIIGGSQTGKTNALKVVLSQMVEQGGSFTSVDLEGSTHEHLLRKIAGSMEPEEAAERFVVVDFTNGEYFLPLNFLAPDAFYRSYTIVKTIVSVMASVWPSAFDVGARMRGMLESAFSLLASHRLPMSAFRYIVDDAELCAALADGTKDELGRDFYRHYRAMPDYTFKNWVESSYNKINPLVSSAFLGPCFRAASCVNFAEHMDAGRSVLIRLDERHLTEDLRLIGGLLVAKYDLDAARREEGARLHTLVLDESQEYISSTVDRLVSRRMKRGLATVIAHQAPEQLDEELLATVLASTRTRIVFSLGNMDQARFMARQLFPLTGNRGHSINEEIEHFAGQLQNQRVGEAVIHDIDAGRTAWLAIPKAEDLPANERVQAFTEASMRRYLCSRADVLAEHARVAEYLSGYREEAKKRAHAKAMRKMQRRRRA